MSLRRSRVLEKLRAGKTVGSVKLNLSDPRVAELAGLCGVDCIWLDLEHIASKPDDLENQIRAAKMHDTDALVRVRKGSYSDLTTPLEMDAAGIMVPHVTTADEARQIVQKTRFHPLGRRAFDDGNADGAYCGVDVHEYFEHSNNQRFVTVQIEDPEAMDQVDEIASVEGIDMLLFGPGDFTHGLGIAGQMDDPRVDQARKAVVKAAANHGKFAATVATFDNREELLAMGFQFLNIGADVIALREAFTRMADVF